MDPQDPRDRALYVKGAMGGGDAAGRGGGPGREANLADLFERLVTEWRQETRFLSSITEMAISPPYQKIIGLGPAVLPFLFQQLRERPDHWFWALKAITREDPVPEESRGNLSQMTEAWLHWAQSQGYAA